MTFDYRLLSRTGTPESEFLDEIHTKVFLLAIQSHLYNFALRFLFLKTHTTCYSFYCALLYTLYTVKEKGGKTYIKTYHLPYGLRIQMESSSLRTPEITVCPETSKKLYVHEFGFWKTSGLPLLRCISILNRVKTSIKKF
jgi:hypothetical protein